MTKRHAFIASCATAVLLLGGAVTVAVAHGTNGPFPQGPTITQGPIDLPEPGDTPD